METNILYERDISILFNNSYKVWKRTFFMKGIYFKRDEKFFPPISSCSSSLEGIYFPTKETVLYVRKSPNSCNTSVMCSDESWVKEEFGILNGGKEPEKSILSKVCYYDLKNLECEEVYVNELINSVLKEMDLRNKNESGLESLFDKANLMKNNLLI